MRLRDARKRGVRMLRGCALMCDSAGGSLVELALILPILSALVLGASEFALLEYAAIETSNAARAGVAYGAQSSSTASDTTGMQDAARNDSPDVSGLSAAAKEFWSCSATPSTQHTTAPTCTGTGNHVLHYVEVTTTATVAPLVHIAVLPRSFVLTGQAIMRVQ